MSIGHVPSQRRFSGFTLIELLVVISIIALLIAILLPALSNARASGRHVTCLSNMRQIGIVNSVYASEHDTNIITAGTKDGADPSTNPSWGREWSFREWSWHSEFVKAATRQPWVDSATTEALADQNSLTCPEAADTHRGYGISPNSAVNAQAGNRKWRRISEEVVLETTRTFYAGDGNRYGITNKNTATQHTLPMWRHWGGTYDPFENSNGNLNGDNRGEGTANLLFFDGHAAGVRKDTFFDGLTSGAINKNIPGVIGM